MTLPVKEEESLQQQQQPPLLQLGPNFHYAPLRSPMRTSKPFVPNSETSETLLGDYQPAPCGPKKSASLDGASELAGENNPPRVNNNFVTAAGCDIMPVYLSLADFAAIRKPNPRSDHQSAGVQRDDFRARLAAHGGQ